ncbi:MAG TPA: SGNH/GDSL hydrolase family protein, partial [Candidatus Brocadiales bacterium]|nr:SGNH/GDSL hydrolase family protein [Candidatus Brocadiales bacterium]
GDSFTIGYEVNGDETYAAVLEKYLLKKGIKGEVINAGMSGNSNAEELIFLEHEGLKYHPDIVILGFYTNDLDDNVRSDLYHFINNDLVLNKTEYLPAIKSRNFLNSFFVYRWLSEHSYLHNFLNVIATQYLKDRLLQKRKSAFHGEAISQEDSNKVLRYQQRLATTLVKKMYSTAKAQGIYFILLDIPKRDLSPSFPSLPEIGVSDCSDLYLNSGEILKEYEGLVELYQPHGHGHWTAFSHLIVGKHLGEIICQEFDLKGNQGK